MKKYNQRAAAFGMAGALALGTVVSAGVMAPADAATGTYTCTLSAPLGDQPMSVVATVALPASVESGRSISGLASTMGVTIPAAIVSALAGAIPGLQTLGGSATGVTLPVTGAPDLVLNDITIPQTASTATALPLLGSTTTKSLQGAAPRRLHGDDAVVVLVPGDRRLRRGGRRRR